MTWATSVPILVSLGLSVLDLRPDVRDTTFNVKRSKVNLQGAGAYRQRHIIA